jgi:hypothetical protein
VLRQVAENTQMARKRFGAVATAVVALNLVLWLAPFGLAGRGSIVAPLFGAKLVRGEVIVAAGGATADLRIDRGVVTSQTSSQLTLQELDGRVQAIPLSPSTRVYGRRKLRGKHVLVIWPANGAATSVQAGVGRRHALIAPLFGPRLVRGEVIVNTGGGSTADLRVDRGIVTSQSTSALTLQEFDGRIQGIPLSSSTHIFGRKTLLGWRTLVIWAANGAATSVQPEARTPVVASGHQAH